MKFGLEQHIIDKLIAVFEENSKVDKAIVFGSRAMGNYRPDSDIDITIKGQDINTDDIIAMSVAFEEKGITYKVDLINYCTSKEPDLKNHIDRVGIELYSRWKECRLVEIANVQTGPFGSQLKNEQYITGGTPVVTVEHIKDFKIVDFNYPSVTEQDKQRLSKYLLQTGDIIFTRVGSVDLSAYVKPHQNGWMFSSRMLRVRPHNDDINSRYLSYYFQQPNFREYIVNISVGATMPSINTEILKGISISYPPLQEQTAIASFLSSLDDKIDLLHRQNKTLEQLAETLFRSCFPMTNEENKYVELGNYVECINGVSYKSSELNPSKVGMVSLKSFDRKGGFSIEGFKEFTGKYKEKQVVVEGDLIVAHTDITQDAEVIGNPALVISNPTFDTMIISMDIVKVVSKVDWISIEFLYFLMRTREFKSHCEGCANGSTVLHLNKQAIPTFEFPEPDKNKVVDFTKQAREIVNKTFLNHRQLRNLIKTRDTLLPKLMSGEIRVKM